MAIIKCKICGGDLNLVEDSSVCECEYCGTKQTVPKVDDEKKLKLFERANRLRSACEFDKAAGVYETIIADFDQEAEAYWGLILCKFGIEYVDDQATGKKIPTCHRSSFDSLMDDPNFDMVMECADPIARRVYRDEAKAIEELRKRIIEVSSKEEPYDVFISYKELGDNGERTLDSEIAQDIYTELTDKGYRVFFSRISLEDKLGVEYEPYIFAALNSAKVMLVVGTDYDYFNAVWVKNEWSRFLALIASGQKKTLIPVFKGIDAYDMPKEFNKLAAQDMGKVGAMQDLVRGVEKIIGKKQPVSAQQPVQQIVQQVVQNGGPNITALLDRGSMALEDRNWSKAKEFFDQVLNMDSRNAEAFLGLSMAEAEASSKEEFAAAYIKAKSKIRDSRTIKRSRQFSPELNQWLTELDKKGKLADELLRKAEAEAHLAREKAEAEFRQKEEEKRIAQQKAEEENKQRLACLRERIAPATGMIAAGNQQTAAVKANGTVVSSDLTKKSTYSTWKNVVSVALWKDFALGVKEDGTIYGSAGWPRQTDIIDIQSSSDHIVGLKANGRVVAAGKNDHGQCDVGGWSKIIAVSAADGYTLGLRSDGTVLATKLKGNGQCEVNTWCDIVGIAAGYRYSFGLKADGTVIYAGEIDYRMPNLYTQWRVSDWKDIIAISTGVDHTLGLKADGTVLAVGGNKYNQCDVRAWSDIIAIKAGNHYSLGLRADGIVLSVGDGKDGKRNVGGWKLFESIDTIGIERSEAFEKAKRELHARIEELTSEKNALQAELSTIKGLFSGSKKAKIEACLAEIEAELKRLQ